jgi:hypothetical protein
MKFLRQLPRGYQVWLDMIRRGGTTSRAVDGHKTFAGRNGHTMFTPFQAGKATLFPVDPQPGFPDTDCRKVAAIRHGVSLCLLCGTPGRSGD